MEEIVLVTGCDRAKSWTNVAFLGSHVQAQVSLGVRAVDNSIKWEVSPGQIRGAVLNQGPTGKVCKYAICERERI
jgi:hypothetical protein